MPPLGDSVRAEGIVRIDPHTTCVARLGAHAEVFLIERARVACRTARIRAHDGVGDGRVGHARARRIDPVASAKDLIGHGRVHVPVGKGEAP